MEKENKILNEVGNENPFSVPESYFQDFSDKMDFLLNQETPLEPVKHITFWRKVRPVLYIAAMLTGLYISISVVKGPFSSEKTLQKKQVSELNVKEEYIIDEMDDYSMYEYLTMSE